MFKNELNLIVMLVLPILEFLLFGVRLLLVCGKFMRCLTHTSGTSLALCYNAFEFGAERMKIRSKHGARCCTEMRLKPHTQYQVDYYTQI